jgi:hypothetical protein
MVRDEISTHLSTSVKIKTSRHSHLNPSNSWGCEGMGCWTNKAFSNSCGSELLILMVLGKQEIRHEEKRRRATLRETLGKGERNWMLVSRSLQTIG